MRRTRALALSFALPLVLAAARAEDAPKPPEELKTAIDHPFDVDNLRLDLDVDLEGRSISGRATFRLHARRALKSIHLDGIGLNVTKALVAGGNLPQDARAVVADQGCAETKFVNDGKSIDVSVDLAKDARAQLVIVYSVTHPQDGLHFYGPTTEEPDVPLQVWSQGESTENRYWFPCVDHPSLKQRTEIVATVPAGNECLSNGALLSKTEDKASGKTTWHWREAEPHVAYLVTLVVGKFHVAQEEWTRGNRKIPVLYYVPLSHKDDVERSFGHTKEMLTFFSDKIGVDYAWEKYAQICVEQFNNAGMENTSATTLFDTTLHDARAHLDYDSDGLVSHELAHQWWGDLLTCNEWAHIWLNEGFASYFEALWDEHKNGEQEFLWNMFEKSHGAREGLARTRPIVDRRWRDEGEVFDTRAYPKGAWVLHMLRRRTGDELFFASLKRYCEAHRYGTVETVDLRRAFEQTTGDNLERFFYDWTERPGHPSFEVEYGWDDDKKLLEVSVKQTQQGEEFRCAPTLAVELEKPGAWKDLELDLDAKEKRFLFPLAARPTCVRFDAGEEVLSDLKEEKADDWWHAQLDRAPDVIGRIRAARHLAETRAPRAIEAVAKRMREDKEWMVQSECAEALGKAGGDEARDALLAAIALPNPKARHGVVKALGAFRRDEKVFGALLALVEKGDASYSVESDAIASLARVAADDASIARARGVLEKVLAERPSHGETLRRAAIDGLATLAIPDVLPSIQRWIPRGNDPQLRRTAMAAAARTAILPDATDKSRFDLARVLAQTLDDGGRRVRWSAIDALSVLGKDGSPALAALEHVAAHDPESATRERAKKAAEKIAAGTPTPIELARIREELAKMREREERLEKRLEKVEAKSGPSANGKKQL